MNGKVRWTFAFAAIIALTLIVAGWWLSAARAEPEAGPAEPTYALDFSQTANGAGVSSSEHYALVEVVEFSGAGGTVEASADYQVKHPLYLQAPSGPKLGARPASWTHY